MTRSNKVTVYVNDAELSRLDREADDRNMSRSGYVLSAVQRQWRDDDADEAADRLDAEEKVEQIVADAKDELVGIARDVEQRNEDVADMTARAGSYSIANFELLKDEFDPAESRRAETLLTGSRRLRSPLAEHPDRDLDIDPDEDEGDESDEDDAQSLVKELRDSPEQKERKKRQKVARDHARARRELRKRKRREEKERDSGLSGLLGR